MIFSSIYLVWFLLTYSGENFGCPWLPVLTNKWLGSLGGTSFVFHVFSGTCLWPTYHFCSWSLATESPSHPWWPSFSPNCDQHTPNMCRWSLRGWSWQWGGVGTIVAPSEGAWTDDWWLQTVTQTSAQLLTLEAAENTCNATWCSTIQNHGMLFWACFKLLEYTSSAAMSRQLWPPFWMFRWMQRCYRVHFK